MLNKRNRKNVKTLNVQKHSKKLHYAIRDYSISHKPVEPFSFKSWIIINIIFKSRVNRFVFFIMFELGSSWASRKYDSLPEEKIYSLIILSIFGRVCKFFVLTFDRPFNVFTTASTLFWSRMDGWTLFEYAFWDTYPPDIFRGFKLPALIVYL